MSLFATKSIDELKARAGGETKLRRVLGPVDLTTLGIGAIIGTGIFVLTGQAAAMHAGPAIVLSMVIAGIVSALAALCYAEFASTVPVAGSAYTYGYATLGELVAWIIGWDLILEYALGAATVAVGWSGYVVSFLADLGYRVPAAISAAPGTAVVLPDGSTVTAIVNLPAILIALAATVLLVVGIQESARVNAVIVAIKVSVVLLIIGVGGMFISRDYWYPFIPANEGTFGDFGWSGVLRGAGVIFFAYIGFDAVSTAAQEAKHPQRDMPIGIFASLIICTVLYVLVSGVMVGLVPYQQLGVPAPMALAVDAARVKAAGTAWESIARILPLVVKLGAIAGLSSTIIVQMVAQPRIFMSMAQDGLLPEVGGRHPPAIPHAARDDDHHRSDRGAVRGLYVDQRPRRARQHRHAVRLRGRRHRRDRAAAHAPGFGASLPNARRPMGPGAFGDRVVHPDGRPVGRYVDPAGGLDGDRAGALSATAIGIPPQWR